MLEFLKRPVEELNADVPLWSTSNPWELKGIRLVRVVDVQGPADPVSYLLWISESSYRSDGEALHVLTRSRYALDALNGRPIEMADYHGYPFVISRNHHEWTQGPLPTVVAAAVVEVLQQMLPELWEFLQQHELLYLIQPGEPAPRLKYDPKIK